MVKKCTLMKHTIYEGRYTIKQAVIIQEIYRTLCRNKHITTPHGWEVGEVRWGLPRE